MDSGGRTAPPPASTHHGCVVEKILKLARARMAADGNPTSFRVSKSTKSLELHGTPWLMNCAEAVRPNCLLLLTKGRERLLCRSTKATRKCGPNVLARLWFQGCQGGDGRSCQYWRRRREKESTLQEEAVKSRWAPAPRGTLHLP